jgi:hypothetical protein
MDNCAIYGRTMVDKDNLVLEHFRHIRAAVAGLREDDFPGGATVKSKVSKGRPAPPLTRPQQRVLASLSRGFLYGLAQMSSAGPGPSLFPKRHKSAAEAFHEDWNRIGGDMTRAVQMVREQSLAK